MRGKWEGLSRGLSYHFHIISYMGGGRSHPFKQLPWPEHSFGQLGFAASLSLSEILTRLQSSPLAPATHTHTPPVVQWPCPEQSFGHRRRITLHAGPPKSPTQAHSPLGSHRPLPEQA